MNVDAASLVAFAEEQMQKGMEMTGEDYHVVSVIGDGSMTGGMAFEALNNAAALKKNFIIVLNDNNMSISENHGGLYEKGIDNNPCI